VFCGGGCHESEFCNEEVPGWCLISKIVVFVLKRKVFFTENRKGSENLAPFSLIIWNSVITSAF
jgi:hypothetical protein